MPSETVGRRTESALANTAGQRGQGVADGFQRSVDVSHLPLVLFWCVHFDGLTGFAHVARLALRA